MSNDTNATNPQNEAPPKFDSIRQINPYGAEYWSARDLMPLLGYRNWREFESVIKKARIACEQGGQIVEDHIGDAPKLIKAGNGATRKITDYNLSRFACYLTAQNGDPRKPAIAAAMVYFAVAARENELRQLAEQQKRRVELRERVAEGNNSLNQAAAQAGVLSRNFGQFHNAGYAGLYGGLSLEQIKARKQIGPKEDLLDRAGLGELGANALRIDLTDRKLRSGEIVGETAAIQTHQQAGKEIREAIERFGGPMPEDLPAEPSVRPIIEERQKTRKKLESQKAQPQLSMFDEPEPTTNSIPAQEKQTGDQDKPES